MVVDLRSVTDPDTHAKLCVRYWSPEVDVDGAPVALRLDSDGGIPPISVDDPEEVEVIGIVVDRQRPTG